MDIITRYMGRWRQVGFVQLSVVGMTTWLSYDAYQWAARFAETTARDGIEVTAMIAAVVAPISGLMGYVFKQYVQGCAHTGE